MAFSKQPAVSTYQTKQLAFADEFSNRTGNVNKDLDFLNCFLETSKSKLSQSNEVSLFKRAGMEDYITTLSTNVRGLYYWEDASKLLVATDNNISIYNSDTGVFIITLGGVLSTTSGDVGFTEFLYPTNEVKIVVSDGTTLGTIDSLNVFTTSVSPDLPVPHLPQPLFLDGYLFLVKAGTADIYNSNLDDPLLYTAGDFISCEMFPDTVLRFAKLNNYLVAFGSASIEYFWDAANTTGSPLQRNDTPVKLVGFLGGYAQSGNNIIFVGSTATATPDVYLVEDFKLTPIGDETVRRYLESLSTTLTSTIGNIVSFMGHDFYVLNVGTLSYVYDLGTKTWVRWAWRQFTNFALEQAVSIKANATYSSLVYLNSHSALAKMNSTVYRDSGTAFTSRWITKRHIFDTYNQKTMSRLCVHCDRSITDTLLDISWSDDDYQTFTTPVQVNLNQELPSITRLGRFRRRAFKMEFTQNAPFRGVGVEVDINIGQH